MHAATTRIAWICGLLLLVAGAAVAQTASVQIIHNSPDPAAEEVDVYVGGALALDDFGFREATGFLEVPAGVAVEVGVAPANSTGAGDVIATFSLGPLAPDSSIVAVATGVLDPSQFAANPGGASTAFQILTFSATPTVVVPGLANLAVVHGAPDAPAVDAYAVTPNIDIQFVDSLGYPEVADWQPTTAAAFQVQVTPAGQRDVIVGEFSADLNGLAGQNIIALASGFLDPDANQGGEDFGILVVLADGTSFLMPPPPITVRSINAISDESLAILQAGGADLTQQEVDDNVKSLLNGQRVRFVGVVLTDPLNSGRASVQSSGRVGRVHIFVRDTSAASQGLEGMTIQVVDGAYEQNGTLGLTVGDVVDVVGQVTYFDNVGQITPESIQVVGFYTDFDLPDSILDPVPITTGDLNVILNDEGQQQVNWENYADLINQYVIIENAIVQRRNIANTGRPWTIVATPGESWLLTIDTSLRYRNDRGGSYPNNFNVLDEPFVPPPPGSVVNLRGFITFDDFDPAGLSVPGDANLKIVPWTDDDLEILETPPIVGALPVPAAVPTTEPISVVLEVTADPSRELASVRLGYSVINNDTDSPEGPIDTVYVDMAPNAEGLYEAAIPAQDDGLFVRYFVEATDNQGSMTVSPSLVTRFLAEGIDSIMDVQLTLFGEEGPSPFVDFTTDLDITGVVNSHPDLSGYIVVQDDPELGPWTGILVEAPEGVALARGDSVRITSATVQEIRGIRFDRSGDLTGLGAPTVEVLGSTTPYGYKVVPTSVLTDESTAEAHEGMMLRFENVLITNNDAGFGEWAFSSTLSEDDAILADDDSPLVPGGNELFGPFEIISFLQGVWSHSFGDFKLMPESLDDIGEVTNVANEEIDAGVPGRYALDQNYPNPFNPSTTITYNVGQTDRVLLEVYDMMGRKVATLVDAQLATGRYQATFNAADLASGIYIYRLTAGNEVLTRKMLLQK